MYRLSFICRYLTLKLTIKFLSTQYSNLLSNVPKRMEKNVYLYLYILRTLLKKKKPERECFFFHKSRLEFLVL